ncbi:MAG: PAS domain S-box protein [Chloroflexi bacterium]|nr:PAS domain S-box protein [Chloroflexota bacterium]
MAEKRLNKNKLPHAKISWSMALSFLLLLAAVLFANSISNKYEEQNLVQATRERLNTIADLTAQQISAWLDERSGDARLLLQNPFLAEEVTHILPFNSSGYQNYQNVLAFVQAVQSARQYKQVVLLDNQGVPLLSSPLSPETSYPDLESWIQQAVRSQQIVFSDLYREDQTGEVHLDILVPLMVASGSTSRVAGVILLRIDPNQFLYPLVQSWTTSEGSYETYLARKQADMVVFLSQLRGSSDAPFSLQAPISKDSLSAPTSAGEYVQGVDYRGVQVLGAVRQIANTDWLLVTKVDRQQVYAPLVERQRNNFIIIGLLIFACSLAVVFMWRHREALFYKEQYRAEAVRQVLNEQLTYLTKYANDMILLMDEDWRIVEANDRALANYGYSAEEIRKLGMKDLQFEATQTELDWQAEELRSEDGVIFETVHRRKDLTTFPVECSSRIIHAGEQVFYQSIIRDITDRRSAEQSLRESERHFRQFYEQAPIGYQSLDAEGRFIDVNRAWLKLLGYTKREVLGRYFGEFLAKGDQEKFEPLFEEFKTNGEMLGEEFELETQSGNRVITALYGRASYDETGQAKQMHCILHDVTDQRKAQEKIRLINEELEQRVLERTAQLEAANRELEAFSYSVSHDLRAPLRAIDGFSRILSEDHSAVLNEDGQHCLERIQENTHTMSNLIDSLLAFSRLSRQPLKKQAIDPKLLVQQSLELLNSDGQKPPVSINILDLPPCQADPALLKQVYVNLLSNAIKFTTKREQAIIEVGCLQDNNERIYYVKDNGVGFDMQYAHKLFGVFQRLHRVEDFEGTGVGLAIVQRIIHRHGGRIWALGEINQGATFCFTLEDSATHD